MPLLKSSSKKAFGKNIESEEKAGKPKDQSLAIAYEIQRKNRKKMAQGGKVGGAETSTTGNKTKTGGSNPGGASTGGAGTVTITTGKVPPRSISVSGVGGKTAARNAGGSDPSDKDDKMMMYRGGEVRMAADSRDEREMDMLDDESLIHGQDNNFHDESEPNVDRDNNSKLTLRKMSRGGELSARSESRANIHSQFDDRDEDMLDDKPLSHRSEKAAGTRRAVADDMDSMEEDMMYQENQPDEYSKNGVINYAEGGEIEPMDVVDSIMKRRRDLADGEVDLGRNADEDLNYEDQLSYRSGRRQNYSEDAGLKELYQPKDSNLKGDSRESDEENEHDMIDSMRKRIKARRGL